MNSEQNCNGNVVFIGIIINSHMDLDFAFKIDWETNGKRCCSLGMVPIAIESDEKLACLNKLVASWDYPANYWTSGRRLWPNDTFHFCLPKPLSTVSSSWASGQPDNVNKSEDCVHLYVNKTGISMQLTDENCNSSYIFACQGAPTPAPPCSAPVCPVLNCLKDTSRFSFLADQKTQYLTNPAAYGLWFTVNERTYLFSTSAESWLVASKECCKLGMTLLSIENDFEYANLQAAVNSNKSIPGGAYWTSASDEGCERSFGWCSVNQLLFKAVWAQNKPDDRAAKKNCAIVLVDTERAELHDQDCSTSFKYICEARDTSKSTTSGSAIKNECAAVYNVSDVEMAGIFNYTKLDTRIKMVNGKLVTEGLIKMAEMTSTNDANLQQNLIAVDECAELKGKDECDTAALVYQCGQQKAPNLVANVIAAVEFNTSAGDVPLPPTEARCPSGYSCVIDPDKRRAFEQNTPLASIAYHRNACGGKTYVSIGGWYSFEGAASVCCQFGLRLVSIETIDEFNCLNSLFSSGVDMPLWTSGSSLANVNAPKWCGSESLVNVSAFKWNLASGGSLSSDPSLYFVVLFVAANPADSRLLNMGSNVNWVFPLCEE
ncbi:uncharacterized protein LOC132193960 isoform X2 [Neocloeon triangulifer]|uniref:uncharacterized protein LOC132193960 isoform X2 n=1 Tax=Neocloeon triangulifer TaxID=2078957 RepID=UPI00286EC9AA|nr:uncharacterized protein LOC132193960 isoform X2 [Neocloeon triangulifer]